MPIKGYNREIWLRCLEDMVYDIASFFRLSFPLGEIAVFSEKGEDIVPYLLPFGKIVTITGIDGKSEIIDGVTVRRIKKLKSPPDLIVREGERRFSPIFRVPEIYFGSGDGKKHILSCDTISCKTNLFTFEADLESVMYFVNKGEEITFEISSFRKKSPSLFTFG